ncbi:saccharopine dehydrogenase-like oxidoreductase [Herpailurus yagouaroundi]|uniref:saccharopine dehydrogenase-like oxidoreductase n=1 Tax=Herpailurus yagouaroundi TaxID=1608482 RepID=UPI001AD69D3A|nr:saccharopine dehydrogenase-like oxidoreductase [Puma yagouaroundi]
METNQRPYHLVVFGASGFTGQFVAEEVAREQVASGQSSSLPWAVAGRSREKLQRVLERAALKLGRPTLSSEVGIIICDVTNPASLDEMAKQAAIVLNCVGPYRFYGEPVVKACVENGTSYIDICGEPQFLELMYWKYHEKAAEKGAYIIGSSGFDSIPADLGVIYTKNKMNGTLTAVESFLTIHSGPEVSFSVCQVIFIVNIKNILEMIHALSVPEKVLAVLGAHCLHVPDFRGTASRADVSHDGEVVGHLAVLEPGTVTGVTNSQIAQVVTGPRRETLGVSLICTTWNDFQSFLDTTSWLVLSRHNPITYSSAHNSLVAPYRIRSASQTSFRLVITDLAPIRPLLFPQMDGSSFTLRFFGQGYSQGFGPEKGKPNTRICTQVKGPEPGYVATPIAMVQAAMTLLNDASDLPSMGGVFTPGAAFFRTKLIDRLNQRGMEFSVISSSEV